MTNWKDEKVGDDSWYTNCVYIMSNISNFVLVPCFPATVFGILDHFQVLDHRGAPSLLSFHAAVSAYTAPATCYRSYTAVVVCCFHRKAHALPLSISSIPIFFKPSPKIIFSLYFFRVWTIYRSRWKHVFFSSHLSILFSFSPNMPGSMAIIVSGRWRLTFSLQTLNAFQSILQSSLLFFKYIPGSFYRCRWRLTFSLSSDVLVGNPKCISKHLAIFFTFL